MMRSKKLATRFLTAFTAAAVATAFVPFPLAAVSLGSIELTGGSKKISVDTSAITISGSSPELSGKIINKTGSDMDDVTVSLKRSSSMNSKPTGGDTEVSSGGDSSSASASATSEGTTANVTFGSGGVPPLDHNDSADFDVEVTGTGSGSTIDVYVTPSVKDKSPDSAKHADVLATFELSGPSPGRTNALADPTHDRAYALVTNADRNGDDLIGLAGEVDFATGDPTSVSSVGIYQISNDNAPAGTSVSVTGDTFEITGFSALAPGSSYYVVVVFSGPPAGEYTIELTGDF